MTEPLELDDMQRLILDGFGSRPESRYALLQVKDAAAARAWLQAVLPNVGRASEHGAEPASSALALAFTNAGLVELGLRESRGLLAAFREGMCTPARAADLGDPAKLRWGQDEPIHVLLMVFSRADQRGADWAGLEPGVLAWANVLRTLDGWVDKDRLEHFRFKDGIAQPYIQGSNTSRQPTVAEATANAVRPGEFILGYANEADVLPGSPSIDAKLDPGNALRGLADAGRRDFGRNGTYLVLRQLQQHVEAFDAFLANAEPDPAKQEWLAAKIVGRWRSGAPLVMAPLADRPSLADENDFAYYETDRHGHQCPLGAHIRRANPRDALVDEERGITPELALQQSRRHRLIRRGRLYREGDERGMLFLCLNANIQDQFEFVQHQWLGNPRFAGLDHETDPLVGPRPEGTCPMTLQAPEGSRRLEGLARFVDVVGGGYYFMPGIRALRCLAQLPV